jgi:CheY-like chemotaxis protein
VRGKVTLNKATLDFAQLTREVLQDCRRELDEKELKVSLDIADSPLLLRGDRERMRQVLTNLIHNAGKFSNHGGSIRVSLHKDSDTSCVIQIQDTGIGMSQATVHDIFHPFVQADLSLERGRGGLGLGLAIVKGLVELHGGTVRAESAGLGQGSTFIVNLPVTKNASTETTIATGHTAPLQIDPFSVLVIDDRRDASYPLIKFLETNGHRVISASDGPSGVEQALEHIPDIVICDIGLPGFDGYEVARKLRADVRFRNSLLIAITGYGQPQDKNAAHQAGFNCHLVKPVDRALLLREIGAWMRPQHPAS